MFHSTALQRQLRRKRGHVTTLPTTSAIPSPNTARRRPFPIHRYRRCFIIFGASFLIVVHVTLFIITSSSIQPQLNTVHHFNDHALRGSKTSHAEDGIHTHRPTFLWGIPTMDHPEEYKRRQLVRETYLQFGKDDGRVCSLRERLSSPLQSKDCQLVYTFFMGANPDGPTELMYPNASFPMTVPAPVGMPLRHPEEAAEKSHDANVNANADANSENDIVFLNIKENMEDGKMQTWFKYASMLLTQEHPELKLDYIAKVDSDVLLFVPNFLDFAQQTLPEHPHAVFGGLPLGADNCETTVTPHDHGCPLPLVGDSYMSGELYFMSVDLATFISSPDCDRSAVSIRHEDVAISNFVYSYEAEDGVIAGTGRRIQTHAIPGDRILRSIMPWWYRAYRNALSRRVKTGYNFLLWAHSVTENGGYFKDMDRYRMVWEEFQEHWACKSALAGPGGAGATAMTTGQQPQFCDIPFARRHWWW